MISITYNALGLVFILVMAHLVGDYVLQGDFIAKTKGENEYHLFVHCFLYLLPFMLFVQGWQLGLLFSSHVIIDSLKATYGKITYKTDQILHYLVLAIIFITLV